MNMGTDDFCNSTSEKVPDNYPPIIAAYSKQSPSFVECTGDSH